MLGGIEYYLTVTEDKVQARVKALAKYNKKQKNREKLKKKKG